MPQFDERLSPLVHQPVEQLSPVEAAASPSAVESDAVSVVDEDIGSGTGDLPGYAPTEVATSDEELEAGYLAEAPQELEHSFLGQALKGRTYRCPRVSCCRTTFPYVLRTF